MVARVKRAPRAKFFEQRDGERRAFFGRRAGAHFVHENQRAVRRRLRAWISNSACAPKTWRGRRRWTARRRYRRGRDRRSAIRRARRPRELRTARERAARPTVFSATVLPPVFGPLITITVSDAAERERTAARLCVPAGAAWLRAPDCARLRGAANCPRKIPASRNRIPAQSGPRENRIEMRDDRRRRLRAGPRSARSRSVSSARMRAISASFLFAELHEAIIQINGFERLDENGLPRGAGAVNHARNARGGRTARTGITKRSLRSVT